MTTPSCAGAHRVGWHGLALACAIASGAIPGPFGLGVAQADVPQTIHYQGKLTEPDGTPVVGEHTVTMRLYDAFTSGTKLWEERHVLNFLLEDQGVLSLDLGSRTPFEGLVSFNDPVFLSIEIDTAGELVPRQALTSVGYALNADKLNGARVGTTPGSILKLDAAGALPAVSGANLTKLKTITAADTAPTFLTAGSGVAVTKGVASWEISATGSGGGGLTAVTAGAGLTGGGSSGVVTLDVGAGPGLLVSTDAVSVDVGTGPNQLVQLDATGALPAVSGANLTNLSGESLGSGTIPDARLSSNVSLLGAAIDAAELAADSVGAAALASTAIQPGDIEVGDLPSHAGTHQPGGVDALPTASAVSIGSTNGAGSSSSLARADHTHQGLHSLAASGQPQIVGEVLLAAGSNISLSQSGQTITVASSGAGAPGNRVTTSASAALAIGTASDTTLLSVTITKAQASSALLVLATVQLNHVSGSGDKTVDVKLFRDATQLDANYTARLGTANQAVRNLPVELHTVDTSGTGTFTVTLRARSSGSGAQATTRRLTVLELP